MNEREQQLLAEHLSSMKFAPKIDKVAAWVSQLIEEGFSFFRAAEAALMKYAELCIPRPDSKFKGSRLVISPFEGGQLARFIHEVEERYSLKLCPIGTFYDVYTALIDPSGRVFADVEGELAMIGDTIDEAVANAIAGKQSKKLDPNMDSTR
jgi:hypothetical protein